MELLLIRHAEPVRTEGAETRADPPLTARGEEQARRLSEWLRKESIDALWSSGMRRARQTAAPLADALGLSLHVDERLAEFDRDQRDYIPAEELKREDPERWRAMADGRWDEIATIDLPTFRARVSAALDECIAANPGRRVAVVCHGGVINVWIGGLLGLERPLWFDPHYTGVSRVLASRNGVRTLSSLNERAHLR